MSSLVEGDEGLYLPNCQSNLVIVVYALSLLFCNLINTTAYSWADIGLQMPLTAVLPAAGFELKMS